MVRTGRSSHTAELITESGTPVRLATETWWAIAAGPGWGAALCYRHPRWVETVGDRVAIRDYTAWAQLIVPCAVLVTMLLRRSMR